MAWQPDLYTGLAAVAATAFGVLYVVGRRTSTPTASAFSWLMLGGLLWAGCYGLQLGFVTRADQLLWQRATFAASSTVPPLLLFFVLQYAGEGQRFTRRVRSALVAEAAGFTLLAVTNPVHHLVWTDARFDATAAAPVLDLTFGVGFYGHVVLAYLVVGVALGVLFTIFFRGASVYQRQSGLLLLGALPAFLAHVAYTFGRSPVPGLDVTPFAFTVTGVLYGLALFHFDLLERTPVAQRRALDVVGDGLLVVDTDGRVVDANSVSRRVYGFEDDAPTFERATGHASPRSADGTTETAVVDGARRVYDVHTSPLDDGDGVVGSAVVLRDVTERNASEQQLAVANRVLRHNIRNDMNVILGYAALVEADAESATQAQHAATIHETATALTALSENLRRAVTLDRGRSDVRVDAAGVVSDLLAEFRAAYPDVTFDADSPADAPVTGLTERALSLAVRNLLDNAVEHNERAGLSVGVSVERAGARTLVAVSDDGSGLPEMERRVLEAGSETPLEHSSGVGLWLTHWIVDRVGGDVAVETKNGTTVTLALPAAAPPTAAGAGEPCSTR